MKTAIIYARVSTARQADEGISIDSQIERSMKKAADLGANVLNVFRDEGKSGKSDRLPVLAQLRTKILFISLPKPFSKAA